MKLRNVLPSLALLAAGAALAAPPLAIPIPRPTPEQEALMAAQEEEELIRAEIEEASLRAAAEPQPASAADESAPAAEPVPAEAPSAPPAEAPSAPPAEAPSAPPAEAPSAPPPAEAPSAPPAGEIAPSALSVRPFETNAVFRRDPFWPVAVARSRKADHDARIAVEIAKAKRAAEIEKIRQEAIRSGIDVEAMDEDEIGDLVGGPDRPVGTKPKSAAKFAGVSEEEWDAALAKIPPRSGYLGGKNPALMLKGDKRPHHAGDELCVTNRGVVFVWRISSVDFRAYTHELERLSAKPVTPDSNK